MNQTLRQIVWLLLIFVGVAGVIPDAVEDSLTKAIQAATGRWSPPELGELDDDAEISPRVACETDSALQLQGGQKDVTAPPQQTMRSSRVQPQHASALSQIPSTATLQLVSLRL